MILSQVWYLVTGRRHSSWEGQELRNSLLKYIAGPVIVSYVVVFMAPIFGLSLFPPSFYGYVYSTPGTIIPEVFFLVGAVYVTFFYVYKMAQLRLLLQPSGDSI